MSARTRGQRSTLNSLKEIVRKLIPRVYTQLQRKYSRRGRLVATIVHQQGRSVSAGPFRGMRYLPDYLSEDVVQKLVGSYESELQAVISDILNCDFDKVIDIGSAEGYYCVGFALRLPKAKVIAFERDPNQQELCRRMANWNGVLERVHIQGECTIEILERSIGSNTLIKCDCEGAELSLLDPIRVAALRTCVLVVELHECFAPGVTSIMQDRFEQTHEVKFVGVEDRDPSRYPALAALPESARHLAIQENRLLDEHSARHHWVLLFPKVHEIKYP